MKPGKFAASIGNGACIAAIALMLSASPTSSAKAEEPPWGCLAVSKTEYNAAKSKKMLRNKFGTYMRTGRIWKRSYWYCRG
jgi:hypothetical protein